MTTLLERRRYLPVLLLLVFCAVAMTGCLTAEKKMYTIKLRPDGSGTGTIIFYNILSSEEDSSDVSVRDYTELVNQYLKGKKFEDTHPAYTNVKKRLYEKDGKLIGEITFDFASPDLVGLFRYKDKGTWVYYMGYNTGGGDVSVEKYEESSGELAGDNVPIIFWPEGTTDFDIKTSLGADHSTRSLLPFFRRIGTN